MTALAGARVLVTGGAGTIGSTIVDQVVEAGTVDRDRGQREVLLVVVGGLPGAGERTACVGLAEREVHAAHRDAQRQRLACEHDELELLVAGVDDGTRLVGGDAEEKWDTVLVGRARLDAVPGESGCRIR